MKTDKIYNEKGDGFIRIHIEDKIEYVNPIDFYKQSVIQLIAVDLKDFLLSKDAVFASFLATTFFRRAKESLKGFSKNLRKLLFQRTL